MLPTPSPLLVWGRQYSRADQDWGGGSGSLEKKGKKKKDTVVREPSGCLGVAPHCLPRAVLQDPRLNGL